MVKIFFLDLRPTRGATSRLFTKVIIFVTHMSVSEGLVHKEFDKVLT